MKELEEREPSGHGDQLGLRERRLMMRGVAEEAERRAGFRRWFWGATALEGRLHMAWEGEKLNVTLGCAV